MILRWLRCWCVVVLCVVGLSLPAAMEMPDYDPARHDRFYAGGGADPALREAWDWSGVALSTGGRWGTLVSSSFILSADHWAPGVGAQMVFYPDNTGSGAVTLSVDAGWRVGNTDLWLGHLSSAAPSSLARYAVCGDLGAGFLGTEIAVFGRDDAGGTTSQRIGRNVIDQVGVADVRFVAEPVLVFDYDRVGSEVWPDEQRLVSGDSGGPEFARTGDSFALVGINYFYYTDALGQPAGSGGSLVTASIAAINDLMRPYGEQLVVVPEPCGGVLLLVGAALLGLCRPGRARRPAASA